MPVSKNDLPAKLADLPSTALFIIFDKFPPEDLYKLFRINCELRTKGFNIWQNLWKNKLERHFPHVYVYRTLPLREEGDWYSEFQKTYQHEYQHLLPSERRLFSITKGNIIESFAETSLKFSESLAETNLNFADLERGYPADINGKSLIKWAQEIDNTEILNYCFSQAKQHYEKGILSSGLLCDLPSQAIRYHQNCEQIVYLKANNKWPTTREELKLDLKSRNAVVSKEGSFLLFLAALNGHLQLVHYLLEIQIEIGLKSFDLRYDALNMAISTGFTEVALTLLAADPESPAMWPYSQGLVRLLQEAISKDLLLVVQALIKVNPELLTASRGYTPLMHTVLEGKLSMVEYLLTQKGMDVEATMNHPQFGNKVTALYIAAEKGDAEMVRKLLHAGAEGGRACEVYNGEYYSLSKSPIHAAIQKGDLKTVKAFIETKPEILNPIGGKSEISPLILAMKQDYLDTVEYLLDQKGIKVEARALHMAVDLGSLAKVKLLLKNNPNLLNSPDGHPYQYTPLIHAIIEGRLPIVKYLLKQKGIELAARYEGLTALHLTRDTKVFNWLLAAHANQNLPLDTAKLSSVARKNPKVLLVDYLAKRKSEPDYTPSFLFFHLPFKWGFSKKEKLAAAEALKAVMFKNKSLRTLDSHQGALNNGRLKGIYHKYLATRGLTFANKTWSWP